MEMRFYDAYRELCQALQAVYDAGEAAAVADMYLQHFSGLSKTQRLMQRDAVMTPQQTADYKTATPRLVAGEPVQYVIGEAWFMGRQYVVNKHVLIPRPETEELVAWVAQDWERKTPSILDIGSGSGCIPISLQLALPGAVVESIDISTDALNVAKANAQKLQANVQFRHGDFLNEGDWKLLDTYDIIVSNPPYIPESEAATLHDNVRAYEPGLALFVPDGDALLFYRAIARFGKGHLKQEGAIYCELHRDHAAAAQALFKEMGYTTELRDDLHGNPRMLKAVK